MPCFASEGSEPVRLRTTTISILAIGLLAGSALGVAAQGDSSPTFFSWTYGDGEAEFVPGEMDESVSGSDDHA